MSKLVCLAQSPGDSSELKQIAMLIERGVTTDEVIVQRIGQRLDILVGATDARSIAEKAQLVWMAAYVPHTTGAVSTVSSRDKRRTILGSFSNSPLTAETDGRQLLYFAAGMMGAPIDQEMALRFARNMSNPHGLRLRAVEAVLNQELVAPGVADALTQLSKDDWHYLNSSDVGPPSNIIVYPIRESAIKALQKSKKYSLENSERKQTVSSIHPEVLKSGSVTEDASSHESVTSPKPPESLTDSASLNSPPVTTTNPLHKASGTIEASPSAQKISQDIPAQKSNQWWLWAVGGALLLALLVFLFGKSKG